MKENKLEVIIIEDEGIFALDMKCKLTGWGFEVTYIEDNYYDAIERMNQKMPDLVITDINIKGLIDGIEAAKYLRYTCNVPSLFISSRNDSETFERISGLKPIGFLIKPLNDEMFYNIMHQFKDSGSYHRKS
ncbi:MAG TPA: response regulator [Ignavibacteria bacterium]|nr:hypothetical protein [Bacteroidota bacterium]HRE10423.1 response regulator [Ignavibacteria bacterium]HRF65080.1 response regulator [Ignavibacteria bacterium]HRJ05051.1 response regulator [Ignavibacteria bacterium]